MKLALKIAFVIGFLISTSVLFAQGNNPDAYTFTGITLEKLDDGQFIYYHKIRKGETIYRLATIFGLKSADIFEINPNLRNTIISIGEIVAIPVKKEVITKEIDTNNGVDSKIPVYYMVRPKENLFRISRIYFGQKEEEMMARNKLTNNKLSIGQKLKIGWIVKKPVVVPMDTISQIKQELAFEMIVEQSKKENIIVKNKQEKSKNKRKSDKLGKSVDSDFIQKGIGHPKTKFDPSPPEHKEVNKERAKDTGTKKYDETKQVEREQITESKLKDKAESTKEIVIEEKHPEKNIVKEDKKVEEPKKKDDIKENISKDNLEKSTANKEVKKSKETVESKKEVAEDEETTKKKKSTSTVEIMPPKLTVKTNRGLAIWKKDSADTENLFALHPTARVNTMIEITNPMMKRKVMAKVIGNLPKNSYPDTVMLVVTPRVAQKLGVIDSRFFVEIRYLE